MAKTVTEAKLATRTARAGLPEGTHFRSIDENVHLFYRRGKRGGTWGVRAYCGDGQYRRKRIGVADDIIDEGNLTFDAAVKAARAKVTEWRREEAARAAGPVVTVRTVVEAYIASRDARESARAGRPVKSSASHKLRLHVLENAELSDTEIHKLKAKALQKWRKELPGTAATRQRVANDFRAALNRPDCTAEVELEIKAGFAAPKDEQPDDADDQVGVIESKLLTDDQIHQLLAAVRLSGDEDFFRLCLVLARTGARFAQVRRLKVRDVQVERVRIMMPASHKGRVGSASRPPVAVPVEQDVIDALLPVIKGRKGGDTLLERWRHRQVRAGEWKRESRGPWQTASELSRPLRAAVQAADLPPSTSSYSFRHSSINRALGRGLPVRLVAQVHDTSIKMIEANYTHHMADAYEDIVRKAIAPMMTDGRGDNVVPFERQGA